ncbi:hypothetical protein [Yoonia sp. 2307UL14-13]|uniref:hypothetical protein n=1 Tax=Yoonia sp. 2307UL14-13 TaxID=3126506 RepID=UPI00309EEC4C
MSEEILLYVIPAITLLGTGGLTYMLAKKGKVAAMWTIGGLVFAFSAFMFIGLENASGWDGLGYLLALLGLCAPGAAGFGLGGVIGWITKPQPTAA